MKYEEIKLNISNDKISNYKVFKGMKLYSEIFKSEDEKKLINKRVFVTPKGNYVYYAVSYTHLTLPTTSRV